VRGNKKGVTQKRREKFPSNSKELSGGDAMDFAFL
jgi:hypothetical protein